MKRRATLDEVHAFLKAVYPQGSTLATLAFDEQMVLREATRQITELRAALQGIIEIGKRDMSNPKYDGYFEAARRALK